MRSKIEVDSGSLGSVGSVPACSENPTTATTPAETKFESLVNVTVIVD